MKKVTNYFKKLITAWKLEIRENRKSFIVYWVLRCLVLLTLVLQIINGNYGNAFTCLLALLLLTVPGFIQTTFHVELPTTLEIIIYLFIFATEILGEIDQYYLKYEYWDVMLHTLNGFLAAAIGYSMVTLLNEWENIEFQLSPLFTAVVAFCFSMTIGVVWEFFEFGMDTFFGLDTQKDTFIETIRSVSLLDNGHMKVIDQIKDVTVNGQVLSNHGYLDIGLIDTMEDLFVNFIGAFIFSVLGFFFTKNQGKGRFAKRFIPSRKSQERDYFNQVFEIEHKKKEQK